MILHIGLENVIYSKFDNVNNLGSSVSNGRGFTGFTGPNISQFYITTSSSEK